MYGFVPHIFGFPKLDVSRHRTMMHEILDSWIFGKGIYGL